MPKFLVTSGSYFQPFTYDELAKPIAQAVEAHNTTQDVYDQLSMETSALGRYISDNPGDSEAKMLYENYLSRLNSLQENLWNNGYNASTRRDLAAARAGYASNITRLQTAIKARQERSKEYWDARHKNPNLVTSADPGLSGLNEYLRDDNYGNNWFSYDSAQFEKEVFDESKARAKAMMSDLTDENGVVKNPALKTTLTRVIKKGFTNDEVDAANLLVDVLLDMPAKEREGFYATNSDEISPVVKMLTESLINRYDATGIRGYDVSDSERQKLINRGKSGLVGGIMEPDIKDFEDPDEEYRIWEKKEQWKLDHANDKNGSGSGNGKDKKNTNGYTLNSVASYLESADTKKLNQEVNENFYEPYNEPISVIDSTGKMDELNSAYDAQKYLNAFGKERIKNKYGIDPDNPTGKFKVVHYGNETNARVRYRQYDDALATSWEYPDTIYNEKNPGSDYIYEVQDERGNWVIDKNQTRGLNEDITAYRKSIKAFKDKNPGVDIQKLGISERKWDDFKRDYNISDNVPRSAYPAVMNTLAKQGEITPAYLADSEMSNMLESYTNSLIESYSEATKDKRGDVDKNSHVAVYKVGNRGKRSRETNLKKIFGTNNDGKIKNDLITRISATPEEVIANEISFHAKGDKYIVNPRAFGNDVEAVYREMRAPVFATIRNNSGQTSSIPLDQQGTIHYMMLPIVNPSSAWDMSDEEVARWINFTDQTLSELNNPVRLVTTDENGNVISAITPEQIVMSPQLQEALRNGVTEYINEALSAARDNRNQRKFVDMSSSGGNPPSYYNVQP